MLKTMKSRIETVLGTMPDPAVARIYGTTKTAVWRLRRKLGIPAYTGDKPDRAYTGNRSPRRGHWQPGKPRNDLSPRAVAVLAEAREFFALHALPRIGANPRGIVACARDCKMARTALRDYLKGKYVPCARNVSKLEAWLQQWRMIDLDK